MTSHLTVSSSASATTTGLSTGSTAEANTSAPGGFGAILDSLQSMFAKPAATGDASDTPAKAAEGAATTPVATPTGFVQLASTATGNQSPPAAAAATVTADSSEKSDTSILDLLERLLQPNRPTDTATTTDTPAGTVTVSAPLAATQATDPTTDAPATDAGTPPKLLKDVIEALKQIDEAEAQGQPVGDDLLKKAKKAIDALSGFLATQQPLAATVAATPASGDSTTAPVGAIATPTAGPVIAATTPPEHDPDDGTNAGDDKTAEIATAKASLTALAGKLDSLATATKADPDLAAKLESLAKALDPTTLSADTLRQLGLTGQAAADPKLASAINGLVNGKAQSTTTLQPALGTPELKLPEGTALGQTSDDKSKDGGLSRHSAETVAAPAKPVPGDKSPDANNNGASDKGSDKPATSAANAVVAAAKAVDTPVPATTAAPSADASASAAVSAASATSATARLAQTTYQAAMPPASAANLPQMAYEIVRHVQQGTNHFQIRLDPADLGRVDVNMSIDSTGSVSARLTVERPETLDLLRRDAPQLGQALTQAGLDSSKTNLQFSLSQNPFTRQDNGTQQNANYGASTSADDDADSVGAVTGAAATVYRGTATTSGLNLFV